MLLWVFWRFLGFVCLWLVVVDFIFSLDGISLDGRRKGKVGRGRRSHFFAFDGKVCGNEARYGLQHGWFLDCDGSERLT